jgi:Flp pilus assembly protein TadG
MTRNHASRQNKRPQMRSEQRGIAVVEFALIVSLVFILLFGMMEMGRLLFYWNTAGEATRLGARLAVVCDKNAAAIKARMGSMLNLLAPAKIDVSYSPDGCDIDTCRMVTVSITGLTVSTFIPFIPLSVTMPPFSTSLPRESLDSSNPDCG